MNLRRRTTLSRRTAVTAGLAAAVTFGLQRPNGAEARVLFLRGMAGGGLARIEGGDAPRLANCSLAASSMQFPEGNTIYAGLIQWVEAGTGLQLVSTEISQCVPMPGRTDGAEIRGRMSVNGEGNLPFVINAFDTGGPGSGLDAIKIDVNGPTAREGAEADADESDFVYEVTATLVAGDFEWLIVDADLPG